MRVVETQVFQYAELSDKAKERARQWYRDASQQDDDYSEFVLSDAETIAGLMGIEFNRRGDKPAVYWSGFWSQGDGASFEGRFEPVRDAAEKVKAYAPQDESLHVIAESLAAGLAGDVALWSGRNYYHSGMMQFEAESVDANGDDVNVTAEAEAATRDALRRFADWIYRQLESAYEHENSDSNIAEIIEANEYEFTAEGNRF
jgi:hypothetical protein